MDPLRGAEKSVSETLIRQPFGWVLVGRAIVPTKVPLLGIPVLLVVVGGVYFACCSR